MEDARDVSIRIHEETGLLFFRGPSEASLTAGSVISNLRQQETTLRNAAQNRPPNATFAEEASLQAALDAFRDRPARRPSSRWFAAAAAVLLAAGLSVLFLNQSPDPRVATPATIEDPQPEPPYRHENTRPIDPATVVRSRPAAVVVRNTTPSEVSYATTRTADRPRAWTPLSDTNLFALFDDQPVGILALADGSKRFLFPEDLTSSEEP